MRIVILMMTAALSLSACGQQAGVKPGGSQVQDSGSLVRADGSYPVAPLDKDSVIVKVIQNSVVNLQEADTVEAGLATNLDTMVRFAREACNSGSKPDFLLYNEFPLTGYSFGSRDEKLRFTITIPGVETDALGEVARECDTYIILAVTRVMQTGRATYSVLIRLSAGMATSPKPFGKPAVSSGLRRVVKFRPPLSKTYGIATGRFMERRRSFLCCERSMAISL